MNKADHLERVIARIKKRIAEHDGTTVPEEMEYVSGLEDALGYVEIELGSLIEEQSFLR